MAKISGLHMQREGIDALYIDRIRSGDIFADIDLKVKPTEFITFDSVDIISDFVEKMIPGILHPDIIIAEQLPTPTIEIQVPLFNTMFKVTMAFKSTAYIMDLQQQIIDGLYVIDPAEHPIIGAVHLKKCANKLPYDAYVPITLAYDFYESQFYIAIDNSVDIRGGDAEQMFQATATMIMGEKYGTINAPIEDLEKVTDRCSAEIINCSQLAHTAFRAWYAIQISLLNPLCEEFTRTTTVPVQDRGSGNKKSKKPQKKKYIKRLYIDIDKMEELEICSEKTKHKYKKPVWWVLGHWRQYKSGKRVFIKGYWKGVQRETKNAEPREREIVDKIVEGE